MDPHKYSTSPEQRLNELERELKMKVDVYPRWVREGKLSQSTADYRIRCTQDALADLKKLLKPLLNLFS